ncbi:MAG: hypothetical protein HFP77_01260 [Methylococcales symbiont of Iophon sp. n. MRB-2018]|nr:MAG: hypothetical protein HFP77_01260 [Methylococcales symbiont of Iophon sp. n. MRB-2018]KAF3980551.1 MAG: hypothetical protein HFP76_01480 [Methylococcales symbiont of Iophon sp. n. MRB-2018]
MPILNVTFNGVSKDKNGNNIKIAPSIALAQRGPCLQATISIASSIASELLQKGEKLSNPVSGFALIDTGASVTCIDQSVAESLKLPVVDVVNIATASHHSTQQNVYPVTFKIAGLPASIDALRAVSAPLQAQGLIALIGRDVLQHCTVFYNGSTGQISLSI